MRTLNLINFSWPRLWCFSSFFGDEKWQKLAVYSSARPNRFVCFTNNNSRCDVSRNNVQQIISLTPQNNDGVYFFIASCDSDKHPAVLYSHLSVTLNSLFVLHMCQMEETLIKHFSDTPKNGKRNNNPHAEHDTREEKVMMRQKIKTQCVRNTAIILTNVIGNWSYKLLERIKKTFVRYKNRISLFHWSG